MARYIMFWEYNTAHCPVDTQEKVKQWLTMTDTIKKMLKSGEIKEYGQYAGETAGYCIVEGNELDVLKLVSHFTPFTKFTEKALLSVEQCEQVWKSLLE